MIVLETSRCCRHFTLITQRPPSSPLFPYTTLFRSQRSFGPALQCRVITTSRYSPGTTSESAPPTLSDSSSNQVGQQARSEEHTSELQSRENLVCRLLLEKKKSNYITI